MQEELDRSFKTLSLQEIPAYFIGYTLTDTQRADVSGSNGALLSSSEVRNRWLQVSVRTGDYNKDNTHKVGGRQLPTGGPGTVAPVDDDSEVLRRAIWLETDDQYRAAAEALIKIKTGREVSVDTAAAQAPDFSKEPAHKFFACLHESVPRIACNSEFDCDVHRAGSEQLSGEYRRYATTVRPDSVPVGTFHSGQSRRWNEHRTLLQL
jgi:hypothetical protein